MQPFRAFFVPLVVVFSLPVVAQSIPETLTAQISENAATYSIKTAQDQVQRIGSLVDAGALPRVRLEQAQRDLADAQDEAVLDRSLYGKIPVQSLTEEMANDMVAAAQRRVDRQQQRIADANRLVDDGIIAKNSVTALQEEMNLRDMALNLAHSRAGLINELAAMARSERALESASASSADAFTRGMEHFEGNGLFNEAKDLKPIETAFKRAFEKPLPISADGETAVHHALGFDHRGRVDVAINPEQKEGQWLLNYLKAKKIPFYAFTHAIPGKATGAHIHIGPGSTRLQNAD
jgi:hypothetical protein